MTKFCPTSAGEGTEGLKKNYQNLKHTENKSPVVSQYSINSFHWKEGKAEREDKENVQECRLKA